MVAKCKAVENARTGWGLQWEDGARSFAPDKETAMVYAAAPDLLEACRILLVQVGEYRDGEGAAKYHAVNIARAAIAKAEGR